MSHAVLNNVCIMDRLPSPNVKGPRNIIRVLEEPARWYIERTQARNTISSEIGP